jgi:hypothetical protein
MWNATQYAILAHSEASSRTWNKINVDKPLFRLMSDRLPIRETQNTDNGPADHLPERSQQQQAFRQLSICGRCIA